MSRPAYVALPGLSTVSVLLNLPCIANLSAGDSPVVIMDSHDYRRLRGPPLLGKGQSTQKDQYLTMAYDDLRRRGVVKLVDYSKLYPTAVQKRRVQQNRELVESIPDRVIQRAAVQGIDCWTGYGRGAYQEAFRRTLGENIDTFSDLRGSENRLRRKMKRETGDSHGWVEKMLSKNIAALEVCHRLRQKVDVDVRGVIASSEHRLSSDFLKMAQSRHDGPTTDILETSPALSIDVSHLSQLNPSQRIVGLDSNVVTETRKMLETVSKIATEAADVQHDDWTLIGLSFALPQYDDLFDFDRIHMEMQDRIDVNVLASETEYVIKELEHGAEEHISPTKLTYEADRIAEQYDTLSCNQMQNRGLTGMVNYAIESADRSRKLRGLLEQYEVSQAAAFLAVSVMNNPFRRYQEETVYQRSVDLMRRLDPPSADIDGEFGREREGETWTENKDWYETVDRDR